MDKVTDINTTLCETILALCRDKNIDLIQEKLNEFEDHDVFSALCALRNQSNEKIDLLCAEYLLNGRGCQKNETDAGNLCAKIVSYLEKRNDFPPEYAMACYIAASLLYNKVNSFELNLGFAIDYDRRGYINGKNEECKKRYETNISFLKSILPDKYENEEMLYKVASFVLDDCDKKQVLDNYWNALREKAIITARAYFYRHFSPATNAEDLKEAETIIRENSSFPDENELYKKEEAKKTRPSITATGTKKSDFFSKVSASYLDFESALSELEKTRQACEQKEKHSHKLGERTFDFWCNSESINKALEIVKRRETYESIFGLQPPEFWENDAIFFKYLDALGRKNKYENALGENGWDFWLSEEKVKNALDVFNEKEEERMRKQEKRKKIGSIFKKLFPFK